MSEIKVNSIKGVGASVAALSINNTDGTCTANISSINGGSIGTTNLVINGAMNVAQRSQSSTTSGYGTVDRWQVTYAGTDEAFTQSQVDVASGTTPYTEGFRKALRATNGNQTSGAGATDYAHLFTKLEAQDIAKSGWNYTSSSSYITLSFWVKSSVAQNFYGYIKTYDATYTYPFETGTLSANTWTKVTKTIAGNSNLVFNNDNGQGMLILLNPFLGTNYTDSSVSLDTWVSTNDAARTPDFATTWWTTNDATLEITGVQLEVGSTASAFAHESYADTLRKCQRYLYVLDLGTDSNVLNFQLHRLNNNAGAPMQYITFPVVMRNSPSMTKDGTSYSGSGYQTNITLGSVLPTAGVVVGDTATSAGESSFHRPNNTSGSRLRYLFSAEL